ncbi:MAG: hypothetical protein M3133_08755 [Actinomycetota bacterium]|nr:hypothetical protein [Actinomycetota bacterium]
MKKRSLMLAATLSLTALAGCGGGGGGGAPPSAPMTSTVVEVAPPGVVTGGKTVIALKDLHFVPERVEVPEGAQVVFVNEDQVARTVTKADETAPGPDFDSGPLEPGATFSQIFPDRGTIRIIDTIHPDVASATVTVEREEAQAEEREREQEREREATP